MAGFTGGVILGLAAGMVAIGLVWSWMWTRSKARTDLVVDDLETTVAELRQERADDKEVNRRLRYELVAFRPAEESNSLVPADANETLTRQLGSARAEVAQLEQTVAEREEMLRRYREALQELRHAIEVHDQNRSPDDRILRPSPSSTPGIGPGDVTDSAGGGLDLKPVE